MKSYLALSLQARYGLLRLSARADNRGQVLANSAVQWSLCALPTRFTLDKGANAYDKQWAGNRARRIMLSNLISC